MEYSDVEHVEETWDYDTESTIRTFTTVSGDRIKEKKQFYTEEC